MQLLVLVQESQWETDCSCNFILGRLTWTFHFIHFTFSLKETYLEIRMCTSLQDFTTLKKGRGKQNSRWNIRQHLMWNIFIIWDLWCSVFMAGSGTRSWRLLKEQWQQSSFIAQWALTAFSAMVNYLKCNCSHAVKHILIFSALTRNMLWYSLVFRLFSHLFTLFLSGKKEEIIKREQWHSFKPFTVKCRCNQEKVKSTFCSWNLFKIYEKFLI